MSSGIEGRIDGFLELFDITTDGQIKYRIEITNRALFQALCQPLLARREFPRLDDLRGEVAHLAFPRPELFMDRPAHTVGFLCHE